MLNRSKVATKIEMKKLQNLGDIGKKLLEKLKSANFRYCLSVAFEMKYTEAQEKIEALKDANSTTKNLIAFINNMRNIISLIQIESIERKKNPSQYDSDLLLHLRTDKLRDRLISHYSNKIDALEKRAIAFSEKYPGEIKKYLPSIRGHITVARARLEMFKENPKKSCRYVELRSEELRKLLDNIEKKPELKQQPSNIKKDILESLPPLANSRESIFTSSQPAIPMPIIREISPSSEVVLFTAKM